MHLEHVNLTVANLARSIDFYRQALGLELRWSGLTSEGQPAAHVGDERCFLALFQGEFDDPVPPADVSRPGFNHLAFVVDDLSVYRQRLQGVGVQPHHEASYEPGLRLYFRDLDGIEVELVQYPSGGPSASWPGEAS